MRSVVRKPLELLPCDATPEKLLQLAQGVLVFVGHEADRIADRMRAAGAADAVDVILGLLREVVVDDVRDAVDVDAARGDVGRDQHRALARLEAFEREQPLALSPVANAALPS